MKKVQRVGLVVKPDREARRKADALTDWLVQRRVTVIRNEYTAPGTQNNGRERPKSPPDLDCVFVLGGDGTFLSAARWIDHQDIPIIGVKFGDVGFLAESVGERLFDIAARILGGDYQTVARMRLDVRVLRDGQEIASDTVLNDIVINKGALARLAHIDTFIDGHALTTYKSDGLIVATPTGSTAYSLAAGGPIIHPELSGIILTPICPFTLTNRPLIVPDTVTVEIRLAEKSSDIMLTFDGQEGVPIDHRDTIIVAKSPHPIRLISIYGNQYYDVLKTKLRWSGSRI